VISHKKVIFARIHQLLKISVFALAEKFCANFRNLKGQHFKANPITDNRAKFGDDRPTDVDATAPKVEKWGSSQIFVGDPSPIFRVKIFKCTQDLSFCKVSRRSTHGGG